MAVYTGRGSLNTDWTVNASAYSVASDFPVIAAPPGEAIPIPLRTAMEIAASLPS
jgi:hypothetical protein